MLRGPHESLEGTDLLSEFPGESALGLLLWCTMRDVLLCAATPLVARRRLFSKAAAKVRLAQLAQTDMPGALAAAINTSTK